METSETALQYNCAPCGLEEGIARMLHLCPPQHWKTRPSVHSRADARVAASHSNQARCFLFMPMPDGSEPIGPTNQPDGRALVALLSSAPDRQTRDSYSGRGLLLRPAGIGGRLWLFNIPQLYVLFYTLPEHLNVHLRPAMKKLEMSVS